MELEHLRRFKNSSMNNSQLQMQHQDMDLHDIIEHLKKMFSLTTHDKFGPCIFKMIDLIKQLEKSGCTNMIL
ncbi:hypothetical protein CR513_20692, partial [Mucuna pruriens]